MKALTLKQPWAWAVACAGKDVENRSWRPPDSLLGQRIAIHAGLSFDHDGDLAICHLAPPNVAIPGPADHVRGAVVAVATLAGWVRGDGQFYLMRGVDTFLPIASSRSPWFFGLYGWMLIDVVALPEPVPCKGAQGLWDLPPDIEQAVLRQVSNG